MPGAFNPVQQNFTVVSNQGKTSDFIIGVSPLFAASQIISIQGQETAGFAITGGINLGVLAGDNSIVSAQAVGANSIFVIKDPAILTRVPSLVGFRMYCGAVTAWNGASLNLTFILGPTS